MFSLLKLLILKEYLIDKFELSKITGLSKLILNIGFAISE